MTIAFLGYIYLDTALADEICADVIPWLVATMGIMCAAFGQENVITFEPKTNIPSMLIN